MIGAIGGVDTSGVFLEGESMVEEEDESRQGSMHQIRENEDEVNNSFDQIRKTYGHKRQKSQDDRDG